MEGGGDDCVVANWLVLFPCLFEVSGGRKGAQSFHRHHEGQHCMAVFLLYVVKWPFPQKGERIPFRAVQPWVISNLQGVWAHSISIHPVCYMYILVGGWVGGRVMEGCRYDEWMMDGWAPDEWAMGGWSHGEWVMDG